MVTGTATGTGTGTGRGRHGNRIRVAAWAAAAGLMLVPLVAMAFTREVHWTASDFAFAAILLGLAGGAVELGVRVSASGAYRTAVGLAVSAAFLLVWINAAVGIIGSEDNPANLMFAGVVAVAVGGAIVARGGAAGMRRAMIAAAVAQVAVFVVAWVDGSGFIGPITVMFAALWLASALLFGRAARSR